MQKKSKVKPFQRNNRFRKSIIIIISIDDQGPYQVIKLIRLHFNHSNTPKYSIFPYFTTLVLTLKNENIHNSEICIQNIQIVCTIHTHKGIIIKFKFATLCKAVVWIYLGCVFPSAKPNVPAVSQRISWWWPKKNLKAKIQHIFKLFSKRSEKGRF